VPRRPKSEPGWYRHIAVARRNLEPLPDSIVASGGVWAVGMVRDEADIIETVVKNLLDQGVERVVVADNLSQDGSRQILEELSVDNPVTVLTDRLEAHYQAQKMTLLARAAFGAGAGWVVPFDADELWIAPGTTVAEWLTRCDLDVVRVPVFNHVPTPSDDLSQADPIQRLTWRKASPNSLRKVAVRARRRLRLIDGNHGVTCRGRRGRGLEIRHYPYRSEEQFLRKLRQGSAALAATDLSDEVGKHWRGLGSGDEESIRKTWRSLLETHNLPSEWWVPREGLVEDPAPVKGRDRR
jgi:Glycosyl transferase family 2